MVLMEMSGFRWLVLVGILSGLAACFPVSEDVSSNICTANGGQQIIEKKRGDGQPYKVCLFEDNRQCELQALNSGECPKGGLKITGYITPASQYCVLTGGHYLIKPVISSLHEQGYCTLHGVTCDADEYFNGQCVLPHKP